MGLPPSYWIKLDVRIFQAAFRRASVILLKSLRENVFQTFQKTFDNRETLCYNLVTVKVRQ